MKFIVKESIKIVKEICNVFAFIVDEEDRIKDISSTYIKYGIDWDKYSKSEFKDFFKFIEKFKENNKIPLEKLNKYFKPIDGVDIPYIAWIIIDSIEVEELIEKKKKILSMEEEELKVVIMERLVTKIEEDGVKLKFKKADSESFEEFKKRFINYLIKDCEMGEEGKWNILTISEDPRHHLVELIDIILDSVDNFKNSFKVMDKKLKKFVNELKEEVDKNNSYIWDITKLKIFEGFEGDIYIHPSIINSKEVSFTLIDEGQSYIYVGWKFSEILKLVTGGENTEKFLVERLRCLGDKSKFNILKLIKNKPMFGQEIAEAMSLTTATVSHHMSALMVCNFVYMDREENKIYYRINKEEIEKLLEELKVSLISN